MLFIEYLQLHRCIPQGALPCPEAFRPTRGFSIGRNFSHYVSFSRTKIDDHNPINILLDQIRECSYHLYATFGREIAAKN